MARSDKNQSANSQRALIGAGVAAAAAAGVTTFLLSRRNPARDGNAISDAPDHVLRDPGQTALVGRTVTINKPRQEVFDRWRDFARFPEFMENVEKVITQDDGSARWTIKAPAGTSVDIVTRITDEQPGRSIAWESTPQSQIQTEGRADFSDAAPGRGTIVCFQMRYDPPGGLIGRGIAKLFQREPNIQARRDLRRFKQLMETGEITTNAGPSGRGEPVTQSKI
jgi:uncharacterized membrane protein